MTRPLTVPQLFALAHGAVCEGPHECHWCASPCDRTWRSDGQRPVAFMRTPTYARRPHSYFICAGCWLLRRSSITVNFLGGGFKDRQHAMHHSWLITEDDVFAVSPACRQRLWDFVLKPPLRFALCLVDDVTINQIQTAPCNDHKGAGEIKAGTPLHFTYNNTPFVYNVHELEDALTGGEVNGKEGGVRELLRILGEPQQLPREEKRGRGRPPKDVDNKTRKVVTEG